VLAIGQDRQNHHRNGTQWNSNLATAFGNLEGCNASGCQNIAQKQKNIAEKY
jgi:hypothetical protein